MAWQWANLEKVLDPWLAAQNDSDRTRLALEAMAQMAEHPDRIVFSLTGGASPLVREVVIDGANVIIVYLHAEQYRVLRLLAMFDT